MGGKKGANIGVAGNAVQRRDPARGGTGVEIREPIAIPVAHQIAGRRAETAIVPVVVGYSQQIDIGLRCQTRASPEQQGQQRQPAPSQTEIMFRTWIQATPLTL